MTKTYKKIEKALDLARCEIRALYKRVGYSDSNVLTLTDEAWSEIRTIFPVKQSTEPTLRGFPQFLKDAIKNKSYQTRYDMPCDFPQEKVEQMIDEAYTEYLNSKQ